MTAPHMRKLPGFRETGKAPTKPIEVLSVAFDGSCHEIVKQTRAVSAGGIDTWWVETLCGRKVVVTMMADRNGSVSCLDCLGRRPDP